MKVEKLVDGLLSESQALRDSNKKLCLAFWEQQGLYLTLEQRRIFLTKCTAGGSITRSRRALKEKYPASEKVDELRYNAYEKAKHSRGESIREENIELSQARLAV